MLIPLVLALVGLGGGLAAGHFMRPPPPPEEMTADGGHDDAAAKGGHDGGMASAGSDAHIAPAPVTASAAHPDGPPPPYDPELKRDYVKLDRQFVVPLVQQEQVKALVILTLSLEVDPGMSSEALTREPKLRDRFLQVLFRHAQSGAFDGVFTAGPVMRDLR
ncbi:MAG: flagellar basal body-associated protein FliL, partial [Pseudomonadota bacterium]|nr:flagellar basal body-associated protein FliL [Pseudomonadota bacterium]